MELNDYISRSRKISQDGSGKNISIAFLSNFTINGIAQVINVLCHEKRIDAKTYTAPYGQYSQEILNKSSNLYKSNPGIIFIMLDPEIFLGDFYYFPYRLNIGRRKNLVREKFKELDSLLKVLRKNTDAKIVINSFQIPTYSSYGMLESRQEFGIRRCVREINNMLEDSSSKDFQLLVFDFNLFCSKVGEEKLVDKKLQYIADMRISPSGLVRLGTEYMAYIAALVFAPKKCIVLDADNTLWGGIIGEDGIANLKLGPEKEGKPFLDFQKRLLALSERGILLAINSSNNYQDVMEVLQKHKYMVLKKDNFACMKINWQDKAANMREIAKELNIGQDSLVFIDDNKANRQLIRKLLPEVFVVDLPEDTSLYAKTIEDLDIFNAFSITDEDKKRAKSYLMDQKRQELKSSVKDLKSFIEQLKVKISIAPAGKMNIPRISQLTQKTNQFNLTTKRYTEEEIGNFAKDGKHIVKCINVEDKFGDYGITGVAIIKKHVKEWEIDSYLLSCRILGRDVEFRFMQDIVSEAKKAGIRKIFCRFIPTEKNKPAENFLPKFGFRKDKGGKEGFLYSYTIK